MNALCISNMIQRGVDDDVNSAGLRLVHCLGDKSQGIEKMTDAGWRDRSISRHPQVS
jgi:hypothetical protein